MNDVPPVSGGDTPLASSPDLHAFPPAWVGSATAVEAARLRESEERLRLALAAGGLAWWEWDLPTGRICWSPEAEALHGMSHGSFPGTVDAFVATVHPDDRDRVVAEVTRAIAERHEHLGMRYRFLYREPGGATTTRWLEGEARMLRDEQGAARRLIGVVADVTARVEAEEAAAFLLDAAAALAESLDVEATLATVTRLAVPRLGDWCAIDLLERDGRTIRRVGVHHVDPDRVALAQEIFDRWPPRVDDPVGLGRALRTGELQLLTDVTDEMLVAGAHDAEHLRVARLLGLRSAIVVPLAARGHVLGALTLVQSESGRRYSERHLATARELARRAAAAIEHALLYAERTQAEQAMRTLAETMPQMVWSTTADGYHDYFNERWYAYTGMPRPGSAAENAEGWNWKDYLHPDDYGRTLEVWGRSLATGAPYEVEYRFKEAATGEYRWFLARARAQRDAAGRIVRWFGTCTDIDDQKRAAAALAEANDELERRRAQLEEQQVELEMTNAQLQEQQVELEMTNAQLQENAVELEAQTEELEAATEELLHRTDELERARGDLARVFEQAPVAVCVLGGPALVLEIVNPRYQELVGHRALVGRPLAEALPELDPAVLRVLHRVRETGEPFVAADWRVGIDRDGDGVPEEYDFSLVYQPLVDRDGTVSRIVAVATDISEQVGARRAAEEANAAKSQFLAAMSHELRTPLNAVTGYAELLALGIRGDVTEEQKEDLARIKRSGEHLLRLINDILQFAKLEAGQLAFRIADVPLARALGDLEALIAPQVQAKGLAYDLALGDASGCAHLVARADRDKVQQIVLNLLSNAIKATAPGGRIAVTCARERDQVLVRVADSGVGIPADQLATIFDPFVQVDRKLSSPRDGVGLGLAISRDLARAMGGDITVESEVGKGSTFVLALPAA